MNKTDEELEITLASRMLNCLDMAIDEAQDSRQRLQFGDTANPPRSESFYSERLRLLDREIENLEALQQKILDKISQNRVPNS